MVVTRSTESKTCEGRFLQFPTANNNDVVQSITTMKKCDQNHSFSFQNCVFKGTNGTSLSESTNRDADLSSKFFKTLVIVRVHITLTIVTSSHSFDHD